MEIPVDPPPGETIFWEEWKCPRVKSVEHWMRVGFGPKGRPPWAVKHIWRWSPTTNSWAAPLCGRSPSCPWRRCPQRPASSASPGPPRGTPGASLNASSSGPQADRPGVFFLPRFQPTPPPGWDFEKGQAPFATQITV